MTLPAAVGRRVCRLALALVLAPVAVAGDLGLADVAILNGQVVDGNGGPRYVADVAISDGRISYIGRGPAIAAREIIDAAGMVVAPGFVDGHSHSGEYIVDFPNRLNESALSQGVTTIVFGADGMFAPDQLQSMLDRYRAQGTGTNVAFYVGHNGIRKAVMGSDQQRAATADELAQMQDLVREGMEMGAVGFSTGLMYYPGMYADTAEVVALTRPVADYGGIYDSHVRDPVGDLLGSDREVITVATEAGVAAKIAHLKAVCLDNAGASSEVIGLVNAARAAGRNIVSDQYPYDGAKTVFLRELFLPKDLPLEALKAALRDPVARAEIRDHSENGIDGGFSWLATTGYACIRVTSSPDYPEYTGLYLQEIARQRNSNGFDIIADMLLGGQSEIRLTLGGIDEADVRAFLVQPWNMIASDGKYINALSSLDQHPRSTGTFPRVLGHYVRELALIGLEEAVRKMSSQPADFLGLADRGRLEVGKSADVVIFDPDAIAATSTWESPLSYARGVRHVLVNGQVAVKNGVVNGTPAGILLRRSVPTPATLSLE